MSKMNSNKSDKITTTKSGYIVNSDTKNPVINFAKELSKQVTNASDILRERKPEHKAQITRFMKNVDRIERTVEYKEQNTDGSETGKTKKRKVVMLGIEKSAQKELYFEGFKKKLLNEVGLKKGNIIQVVGDSGAYSPTASQDVQKFLSLFMDAKKGSLLEYGLTGHRKHSGSCVNDSLSQWRDNVGKGVPLIANIVDYGTTWVINDFNCTVSEAFDVLVFVYDKNKGKPLFDKDGNPKIDSKTNKQKINPGAHFGSDTPISDNVPDELLCVDGGAQSFLQLINTLKQGKPVVALSNLRGDENPGTKYKDKDGVERYHTMFSAADFFNMLSKETTQETTAKEAKNLFDNYLAKYPIVNPNKYDASTKNALLEEGFSKFIKNELWKTLPELYTGIEYDNGKFMDVRTGKEFDFKSLEESSRVNKKSDSVSNASNQAEKKIPNYMKSTVASRAKEVNSQEQGI